MSYGAMEEALKSRGRPEQTLRGFILAEIAAHHCMKHACLLWVSFWRALGASLSRSILLAGPGSRPGTPGTYYQQHKVKLASRKEVDEFNRMHFLRLHQARSKASIAPKVWSPHHITSAARLSSLYSAMAETYRLEMTP